jgi:hypothetical protein
MVTRLPGHFVTRILLRHLGVRPRSRGARRRRSRVVSVAPLSRDVEARLFMLRTCGDARRPSSVVSVIDAVCSPTRCYAACEDEHQAPKLQRQGWTALTPVDTRARTPLRSVKSAACIPCRRRSAYELGGVRRGRPASVPEPAPIRAQSHHPDRRCQGPCRARTSRTERRRRVD